MTMTDIVRYQGASGDMNPMHHDDELARSAGYPEAFSVGMLSAGYLAPAAPSSTAPRPCVVPDPVPRSRVAGRCPDLGRNDPSRVRRDGERRVVLDLTMSTDRGGTPLQGVAEFAVP